MNTLKWYIPLIKWKVRKVLTNHIPHATYLPVGKWLKKMWGKYKKIIVVVLLFAVLLSVFLIKDSRNKPEKYDTYKPTDEVTPTDTTKQTTTKPIPTIKKPWLGFGKETTGKVIVEDTTPKKKGEPTTKVETSGEDFEVKVRENSPAKVTIVHEPIIKIIPRHPFAVGVMATYGNREFNWGVYTKVQPLEIYKIGVFGYVASEGYGVGVGYVHKGWCVDVMYQWNDQLIYAGVSRKL